MPRDGLENFDPGDVLGFLHVSRDATIPTMRSLLVLSLAALTLCFSTSCLRTSTVVRVKKDGTGSIISRYYFSPEMLAMLDQLGQLGGALGGAAEGAAAAGPDLGMIRELAKPDEESLKADASGYGEGVRYAKHEPGKDEDGWEGYTVVYDFDDIRKVRIDQSSVPGKAKEFVASAGEELKKDEGGALSFALEGDVLTVKSTFAKDGMDGVVDQKQLDQAKEMGMTPSEALKMSAGMMQGMRIGYFLRAEDGIAETNADHVTGDLIILSDADLGKVLVDPDLGAFIDKAAADPKAVTPETAKEMMLKLEAMTIESKDEITVKLK
jgi:hypothetical protein